ncbi:hypothetical protein E1B28_002989 [Marasmius oreades]|uniref:Uncharacterized protein n=1 Tax=Marasmius oreades TaxID=181124 RepID=A0A9P7UJX8_9AGAR|nr:uncharacterized protein E1B28_002989 [Marasmius oreades]KAG7085428.1 hypothetical protein E1B28_002989 [Marasmius oreades]
MSLPTTEIQDNFEEPFDWTNIYHHNPPNEDEIEHNIDWDDGLAWAKFLGSVERDDRAGDVDLSDTDDEDAEGSEMEVAESGSESDEEYDVENVYLPRTRMLWAKLNCTRSERPANERIRTILDALEKEEMDIAIFLDLLSWGDNLCIQDSKVQYARSALLHSAELPSILWRWSRPPRSSRQRKKRAGGGGKALVEFAKAVVCETAEKELDIIS